jgi:hypothetical protein
LLAVISLSATVAVKGGPILENEPIGGDAFSIAYEAGNTWGAAVSFTPQQNVDVFSVTLWLTGYTGQNGQSMFAGIWDDANDLESFFPTQPGWEIASLSTPASNDGSLDSFTFYASSEMPILASNTKYWLVIYGTGDLSGSSLTWVDGTSPTGGATYDGSESLAVGSFSSPSLTTPAFTINSSPEVNPVPEPSTVALAALGLAFLFRFQSRR